MGQLRVKQCFYSELNLVVPPFKATCLPASAIVTFATAGIVTKVVIALQ
jgi:hypothetical protein